MAVFAIIGCRQKSTLFRKLSASRTGIDFNNRIVENDSINPLDLEFLYNGGGVAAGDFNGDGLTDLYFTGSLSSNKLYLNKGNLKFEDITEQAHVSGEGRWANGAAVVDINGDGLDDIYVCNSIKSDPAQRKNLLYINKGLNKEGIPVFQEEAAEYHLDDTGFSVQAVFFDYDNDGDLDMYLVRTKLAKREASTFANENFGDTSRLDVDKLYRNDWNDSLKHPVFTDVSAQAGIVEHGFGLGVAVADFNGDGWKDIYVTNDFYGSDLLYINNRNGTFSNKIREYFKHTSRNAMGNDIADLNNDGLADVLAVDMDPEDNYRKKKNMGGDSYFVYQNMTNGGPMLQYVRNTLQVNQGPTIGSNDSIGHPVFSELGFMTGIAETDWSWNPSIADFDNDGNRDIIITNGYPRDVTDHDFGVFLRQSKGKASKQQIIDQIPQIKIPNYAFKNEGHLKFKTVTGEWGLDEPSFSNGAIYADLDNDGDLDYVINNINQEAFVYENTTNNAKKINRNFLSIEFESDGMNRKGIGAIATLYYGNGKRQVYENSPYRGYLSTVESKAFFGLDTLSRIDSVVIQFQGRKQVILNPPVNKQLKVKLQDKGPLIQPAAVLAVHNLFTDTSLALGIDYVHKEADFIDFNEQRMLPHKLSEYGPGMAAGDLDGNGLDDILIGGSGDFNASILFQQRDGKFLAKKIPFETGRDARRPENLGVLLFDADQDGDLDAYFSNGSNEYVANSKNFRDRLYINDGSGNFTLDSTALPLNYTSKECVKAADFDNDGDLDLFVGGRVLPGKYPLPVSSFIYRNVSKPGSPKFEDVTAQVAPGLQNIGMVTDAVWTDFDNDGWIDLIVVGEWMPVTFLRNNKGVFENVSSGSGINNHIGWWNSIAAGDFDNDGDIDYVVGNLGLNSFYRASDDQPVRIYAKDFDGNQTLDLVTTLYLPDEDHKMKEFPARNWDDQVSQLPKLKKRFLSYREFGKASIKDMFAPQDLKGALVLAANDMRSVLLRNDGSGKFEIIPLPTEAQVAPLNGMVIDDFNGDGNLDIAINGNDYGTEVGIGRYDALNGLVLLGDGNFHFRPLSIQESGLYIPGNGKALVKLTGKGGAYLLAGSQNRGPLKVFRKKTGDRIIPLLPGDRFMEYTLASGKKRREEAYYGNSFLSQSSRFVLAGKAVKSIEITNNKGEKRKAYPLNK